MARYKNSCDLVRVLTLRVLLAAAPAVKRQKAKKRGSQSRKNQANKSAACALLLLLENSDKLESVVKLNCRRAQAKCAPLQTRTDGRLKFI
jgi:broad-specificity NMP kinase